MIVTNGLGSNSLVTQGFGWGGLVKMIYTLISNVREYITVKTNTRG